MASMTLNKGGGNPWWQFALQLLSALIAALTASAAASPKALTSLL